MNTEGKNKLNGILSTIIFHSLLIIAFLFMGLTYYIPPPPEEGISINFGYADEGETNIEPEDNSEEAKLIEEKIIEEVQNETEIITQKIEEAPVLEEEPDKEQETNNELDNESEKIIEEKQEINKKALYTSRKPNKQKSQGEKQNLGNQGNIEGIPNVDNYNGGGIGDNGIAYELGGRDATIQPKPIYEIQEQGKVVVSITVDRLGNVIHALAGIKGSTTFNKYLLKKAKEAALKTKFKPKSDAPENQQGKIIYHFRLN
ncbi:MAG: energy transducer TonB [Bacteroidota bacterium]|nr:energy transducer TonB [Bacteroidota bacterium]